MERKMTIKELSEKYGSLSLVRAAVQTVPYFGGAIDTLLASQGAKWQQERINDFMVKLDADLNDLKSQKFLTEESFFEHLQTEEAIPIIVRCIREALNSIEKEKIDMFKNITKNYLLGKQLSGVSEVEAFIRTTNNITAKEFEYFCHIANGIPYEHMVSSFGTYLNPEKIYARPMKIGFGFREDIEPDWKILQEEINAFNKLIGENLVEQKNSGPGKKIITGHKMLSEFHYKDNIRYLITVYGKKYFEWIS
jgi:hypothetical protein